MTQSKQTSLTNPNGLFNIQQLKQAGQRAQNLECIRSLTQVSYQGNHTTVCRVLGQFLVFVSTLDERHSIQLQMNGYWEIQITETLANIMKPGMKALDVGANYGYFAFLMAALGGVNGHVDAIEANPFIVDLLEKSIKVNGFKNQITTHNLAITDQPSGEQPFVFKPQTPMNGSLKEHKKNLPSQDNPYQTLAIETSSLDHLFAGKTIDLMKVDIEGAEEQLWYGSQELRQANPQMQIIMEVNPHRYNNPEGFIKDIFNQGYQVGLIEPGTITALSLDQLLGLKLPHHMMLYLRKDTGLTMT